MAMHVYICILTRLFKRQLPYKNNKYKHIYYLLPIIIHSVDIFGSISSSIIFNSDNAASSATGKRLTLSTSSYSHGMFPH